MSNKSNKIRQHGWRGWNKEAFLELWEAAKPEIFRRPALPPPKQDLPEELRCGQSI